MNQMNGDQMREKIKQNILYCSVLFLFPFLTPSTAKPILRDELNETHPTIFSIVKWDFKENFYNIYKIDTSIEDT